MDPTDFYHMYGVGVVTYVLRNNLSREVSVTGFFMITRVAWLLATHSFSLIMIHHPLLLWS